MVPSKEGLELGRPVTQPAKVYSAPCVPALSSAWAAGPWGRLLRDFSLERLGW